MNMEFADTSLQSAVNEGIRILDGKPQDIDCLIMQLTSKKRSYLQHYHNYIEMLYCLDGEVDALIFGNNIRFAAGDLIVINPNEPHAINAHSAQTTYIVVKFLPQILYSVESASASVSYILPFILNRGEKRVYSREEIGDIRAFMQEIISEWQQKQYGSELIIRANIMKVFASVIRFDRQQEEYEELISSELYSAIERAIEYVFAQYATAQARTAAKLCNLSYSYFSRSFKRIVKKSFSEYVNYVRLFEAERMMLTTDKNITQIALDTGFSSTSHFILRFRAYKGVSPKQFRLNGARIEKDS